MSDEKALITESSSDIDVRNAVIGVFQKMSEGQERDAIREMFERFTAYMQLQTGHVPPSDTSTEHKRHLSSLKASIEFFMTISQILGSLGLITNWKQTPKEMGMAIYERVREDRAKYYRTIALIVEIYTVHLGGNGALFGIEALPDEIRNELTKKLKDRNLLRDY